MCEWGFFILAISVWLFWSNNCFCVCWPFLVFFGVIFTRPRCFRVFFGTAYDIYPPHTSAWHTQTPSWHCQTPLDTIQTPLRHPRVWPCMRPLGKRVISEYHDIYSTDFNLSHIAIICLTPSDTILTLPDTVRHRQTPSRHPSDTPIFGLHETTGRKINIWIPWYLFNCSIFLISAFPDTVSHP